MRKIILSLISLTALPMLGFAASNPTTLVNEPAIGYSNTYPINLDAPATAANKVAVTVTVSSATNAAKSFIDGAQSTGSITVNSNAILGIKATNTITVPPTNQILAQPATAQIVVSSGVPGAIISVNGNQLREGIEWTRNVQYSSMSATNLAAAMNTYLGSFLTAATTGWTTIYATATVPGTQGNSFTLTSSTPTVITTTTWSGGTNPILSNSSITFNGAVYRNDYDYTDNSGTSNGTAQSIATLFNSFGVVVATVPGNGSVIYTTATAFGTGANSYTLGGSSAFTFGSPIYTGGSNVGSISINGVTFTAGVQFSTGASTSVTATNLAAAINTSTLNGTKAAAVANLVTATSTLVGANQNFAMTSSTDAALTLSIPKTVTAGTSVGAMTGGKDSAYTINSGVIKLPSHGFTKALPVLYSGSPAIAGLTTGTTYFAVVIDANNIGLSSTSVVAQAGNYITLTSSSVQTTADTYTLTPNTFIAGSAGGFWQISNDCTNGPWQTYSTTTNGVVVSSQSYTTSGISSTAQDFGVIDFACLRYNVTAPTQGAVTLKVIVNTKD